MVDTGILIGISVILAFLLFYVVCFMIYGYYSGLKAPCQKGQRAISVDGSRSLVPTGNIGIVRTTADFPICSEVMSCSDPGLPWAVKPDGSALTTLCDTENCPCTAFQHCPAYVSTAFREYGFEDRVSLFQVIDLHANDKAGQDSDSKGTQFKDPYDTPYLLLPGSRDNCFITEGNLNTLWPPIKLGEKCLRGVLSKLSTNEAIYLCAPARFVDIKGGTFVFDVKAYMSSYKV